MDAGFGPVALGLLRCDPSLPLGHLRSRSSARGLLPMLVNSLLASLLESAFLGALAGAHARSRQREAKQNNEHYYDYDDRDDHSCGHRGGQPPSVGSACRTEIRGKLVQGLPEPEG